MMDGSSRYEMLTEKAAGLMDIWDCATALESGKIPNMEDMIKHNPKEKQKNSIVLGGKNAGKSTLIQRFSPNYNSHCNPVNETIGLDFSFITNQKENEIQIGNIWELGSCPQLKELYKTILDGKVASEFAVFLVFDLSRPETIISIFETFLSCVSAQNLNDSKDSATDNRNKIHLPQKLWFIGNKSDRFHSYELEKRQIVSRCLHECAKVVSAGVMYITANKQQMGESRLLKVVDECLFEGNSGWPEVQTDYAKSLFLPPEKLTTSSESSISFGDVTELVKSVRADLNYRIPQKAAVEFIREIDEWKGSKKYAEPEIDTIFTLSDAEMTAKNHNRNSKAKSSVSYSEGI